MSTVQLRPADLRPIGRVDAEQQLRPERQSGGVASTSDNPNTNLARGKMVSDREGEGAGKSEQTNAQGAGVRYLI